MTQPLIYRFGLEEVVLLQRAMRLNVLPGVNLSRFQALDSDHQAIALAVADRSLRARNLLHSLQGLEREVNAEIVGTLSEYAHATLLYELTLLSSPSSSPITYAINPRFAVEHIEYEVDIHQFTTMYADEAVLTAIERFLPQGVSSRQEGEISLDLGQSLPMHQIIPALQSRVARQSGQDRLTQGMSDAIAHPQWSMSFTLRTHDRVITTFMLINGASGLYGLAPQDTQVLISSLSSEAARDTVLSAIQPHLSK